MSEKSVIEEKRQPSPEVKEGSIKEGSLAELEDDESLYIDPKEEAKLVRKLDLFIMPMFSMIYFLSFLDRSNIGNARVSGMQEDLGMSNSQYSTSVSILYATYVTFQLPGTLVVKKIGAHRFISCALFGWSMVTIFTSFVRSYGALLAVRLLLGMFESGVFPAQALYLYYTYKRSEQTKRIGYLYVCSCLSGAFGGLIAGAITKIKPVGSFNSWCWLFIVEGLISLICSVIIWFSLPSNAAKAYFLNDREKELMEIRAKQTARFQGNQKFEMKEVFNAWMDPKFWMATIIQFCCDIVLYGFSTFLPSILKLQLGFTTQEAQYLTIPCYIVAGLAVLIIAYCSDRYGHKYYLFLVGNVSAVIGYSLLLANTKPSVNYFATYLIAISLYTSSGVNFTWMNVNIAPHYRRAAALGSNQALANTSGAIAGQIYRNAPYKLGNAFSLGCCVLGIVVATILRIYLGRLNRIKKEILNGEREDTMKERTGDKELTFIYAT